MTLFLETPRLLIRSPQLTDFENLHVLQSDIDVMQYVGNGVRTQNEIMIGLKKAIDHQKEHSFSLGNVYEKEKGGFVGRAGLIYLGYDDSQTDIEIAYALMKSAWGKGYATEIAQALINWGFTHLPVEKLVAVVHPQNISSRRVLEKAKMKYVKITYYHDKEVALYEIYKSKAVSNETGDN